MPHFRILEHYYGKRYKYYPQTAPAMRARRGGRVTQITQIRSTDYNPQITQINADYFFRLNAYP